ncbi:hypothetical protein ACFW1A_22785 [Kitasatospora sp. NPDC058965]|uniref:hypothetical protein n=1 Tax=Kitasatospora sp. NPDC058965 TaxID=3346682 RepID=UPI0036AC4E41
MSQRRSYPNSGDFNLDDLFRPEPAQGGPAATPAAAPPGPQPGRAPQGGEPEYLGGPGVAQGAPWGEQPAGYAAQAPVQEAPATQYLPPYPTNDPQAGYGGQQGFAPGGVPQQQSFGGQQTFGGGQSFGGQPSFGGQQGFAEGGQPSFGGQQSFVEGGQQTFGGQQQGFEGGQPSYGGQQGFGQQTYGGGQTFGGQPAPAEQTTRLGRAGAGSSRRPGGLSRNAVIGGLVAVCAVGAIMVAVLGSGGSDKPKHRDAKPAASTAVTQTGSGGSPSALSADAQAQAQALSGLLGTANSSRQAVIGAVGAIKNCDNPANAQTALDQAATQRKQLLTSLAALKVDKLPTGQQLVDQLNQAWQASESADEAYAAWAGDAVAGCDPSKQGDNPHRQAGDTASGQASTAKKQAASLWNAIATQASLPNLTESQL